MSVAALVKMRDDISTILSQRAAAARQGLRSLGEDYAHIGRIAVYGRQNAAKRRAGSQRAAKRTVDVAVRKAKKAAKKATKKAAKRATAKNVSKRHRSARRKQRRTE
jgi:hypothetical protein